MACQNTPPPPASYEHLIDPERDADNSLRIALLAATTIHLAVFFITWPTIARTEPPVPHQDREVFLLEPVVFDLTPPKIEQPRPEVPRDAIPKPLPFEPTIIRENDETVEENETPPIAIPVTIEPAAPPEVVSGPTTVRVGVEIEAPRVIHRVEPRYTETARKICVEGVVVLSLLINTDGRVTDVTVLRGLPFGLTENAVSAAQQWRFEPCTFNGNPVSVRYTLTIQFRIAS